jgi:hypothetical protein
MTDQPKKNRRVKTVMFSITDGLVHHVHCPKGVRVVIKDYDVDGIDESDLKLDEEGVLYMEFIWNGKDDPEIIDDP